MGSLSNGARFKSKRRKVSCVRDFPPGCGRNAPRINLKHMVFEAVTFHGDKENSMADKIEENLAKEDTVEDFENGNSLSQQMVKDAARDFSPGCGQNAPLINLDDGNSEAEASLGNNEDSMSGITIANVAKGDCIKAFENGNESLFQDVAKSAVWDFPPGCGGNVSHINMEAGDSEAVASVGDNKNSMANKKKMNVEKGDCVKAFENGNESLSQQVAETAAQVFSPGCGLHAPHINMKAGDTEAVTSLCDKENLIADEENVADSDSVQGIGSGNESVSQPVLGNALEFELPAVFDNLVGRVVTALGVNVELSPTTGTMETGSPKASEMKESKLPKELHDTDALAENDGGMESKTLLEIGSASDGMVPARGSKACSLPQWHISDCNMLAVSALKRKFPRRRVSAVRNFPPFCGRNAPFPTEDERQKILLGNKTPCFPDKAAAGEMELLSEAVKAKVEGSPVSEATRTGVEELDADVGDRMKGILTELKSQAGKADVEGNPSIEKLKADVEVSPVRKREVSIVKDEDDDIRDGHARKRKLEGGVPKRKTKSQNAIGKDYEDVSAAKDEEGKEIVVSPLHKSFMRETPSRAAVALVDPDRVIVLGMMAAPNCPRRQGKGSADRNSDPVVTVSKERRHAISSFTTQEKPKPARKLKAMKNLLSSHKEAYKGKAKPVVKDDEDFAIGVQDEDTSGSKSPHDFEVALPPFGPNSSSHGDERNKVRETLRLFQAICRKLLQAEEAKSRQKGHPAKRIDLQAAQIVRDKGKEVNTANFIIGSVPGVEVGDEFQYRVELALVGIHRLYQAGIDYRKHGGMMIATSIVASGAYADDLDNPDVLTYSGQGGNATGKDKQPEDQKLERGNLALKNSITTKNPVRVVRGFKETKASKTDAKAKVVPSYIYDGLYTVERYMHDVGQHGKLVFMFELRRIPGQPGFAWKEVKKSNKFKTREGRCVDDISGGKELFPICAVNTIDSELPPIFNYINEMKYPDWHSTTPPKGCDCIGGCLDSKKCSCVVKNGGEIPYNYNGAIVEAKPIVYECGPSCTCRPSCYNRVTQHGIQIQLEIFKTEFRGWGVRSLTSIPSGSFICEYFGELIEDKEAEQRHNDEYLFDIGKNYSDCSPADGPSPELVEEGCFTIDAAQFGSVGRFINHSCSPNLYAQNVLFDHEDKKMPHIMLFAAENIPPLQELTYHYNYSVDQVRDSSGNIKMKNCYCGSAECSGRMY